MHEREALRGMVPYDIESRSPVFLFQVLLSTRSEGDARQVSPQRHSFALRTVTFVSLTQRNGLRRQHLLLTLLLKACFLTHSHTSFLMFRILLDKGVDSIRWRGTGMVWYYIESRSSVFVFRIIPSTRSDGEARALIAQRHSLVRSHGEHPLFTL